MLRSSSSSTSSSPSYSPEYSRQSSWTGDPFSDKPKNNRLRTEVLGLVQTFSSQAEKFVESKKSPPPARGMTSPPPERRRGSTITGMNDAKSPGNTPRSNTEKRIQTKKRTLWTSWKDTIIMVENGQLTELRDGTSSKIRRLKHYYLRPTDNIIGQSNTFGLFSKKKEPMFFMFNDEIESVTWMGLIGKWCKVGLDWESDESFESNIPDPLIITSEVGEIQGGNEQAMKLLMYTRSELIGKHHDIILPSDPTYSHEKFIREYLRSGDKMLLGQPRKANLMKKNGSKQMVLLIVSEDVVKGPIRKFILFFKTDVPEIKEPQIKSPPPSAISPESSIHLREPLKRAPSESKLLAFRRQSSPKALPRQSFQKTPEIIKSENGDFAFNLEGIVESFTLQQRVSLLGRYAELSQPNLEMVDDLIMRLAAKDQTTLIRFKAEIDFEMKKSQRGGKMIVGREEFDLVNKSILLDHRRFWFENSTRKISKLEPGNQEVMNTLASYIPRLVIRRLHNSTASITAPEMETYPACVMFADVSGFTALTEKMSQMGEEGVERLTSELNRYFGMLIGIIYKYGGDIIKFAGDAVLVAWPTHTQSALSGMVLLGCQCAAALLADLDDYVVEGTGCKLRLHTGIGAGDISGIHVGGNHSRVEFFISGQILEQVSQCEKQALPGETFVSEAAWKLVDPGRIKGTLPKGKEAGGNVRLDSIEIPTELPADQSIELHADMEPSMRMYIPAAVLRHIDSGVKTWLAMLRKVSVIFVNLSAPFKEDKLSELQHTITEMQDIVYRLEGTVRQFMIDDKGSVFIVGFGLPPLSHQDDSARAVECALDIHAVLSKLGVPCSIGVTTGQAFCGDVGSSQRREYAMVGDIVNLSARLMAAAKGGILVDLATQQEASKKGHLSFDKLDDIRVKGKTALIPVYIPSRCLSPFVAKKENSNKTLVGRSAEQEILKRTVSKLSIEKSSSNLDEKRRSDVHYRTRIICLEGDAGVGKSKLVDQAVSMFSERSHRVFTGTANEMENSKSYHAWQDIFMKILDAGNRLPIEIESKLDPELLPLLNVVLPLGLKDTEKVKAMSGQSRAEATHELLTKVLTWIIPPGSLVVLENAHWFDSGSWGLVLAATNSLEGALIILALRPMTLPLPLQYSQILHSSHTQRVILANLTLEDTTQLIGDILSIVAVPDPVAKEIYTKGSGNPFLTTELVNALKESGSLAVTKTGECKVTGDIAECLKSVPNSLTGLLTSRVDRLLPEQVLVLKVASVIGQMFTVKNLEKILELEAELQIEGDLVLNLKEIESANIILSDGENYIFSNSLMRDAVYSMMLFSQRRKIHYRVATLYQKEFPGNSSYYSLIGYHYKHAEADREAIDYLLKSGTHALFGYANKEAVSMFEDASESSKKLEKRDILEAIGIERKLGQAYYNLGMSKDADEHFREALELMGIVVPTKIKNPSKMKFKDLTFMGIDEDEIPQSEVAHRRREAVLSLLALAKVNYYSSQKTIGAYCANLALKLGEGVGQALVEAYATAGLMAGIMGESNRADEYFAEATNTLQASGRKQLDVQKTISQFQGMYYTTMAHWDKSIQEFQQAIEAATTIGDLRTVEECQIFVGTSQYFKGDVKASLRITEEVLESARKRGDGSTQMLGLLAQARNYYTVGKYAESIHCLEDVKIGFESGSQEEDVNYTGLAALIAHRRGESLESYNLLEKAYERLQKLEPGFYFLVTGYLWLMEVCVLQYRETKRQKSFSVAKQKQLKKIEKYFSLFAEFATNFKFAMPRVHLWKGAMLFLNNKGTKAETEWSKATETARALGMEYERAFIIWQRGAIIENTSDSDKAIKIFSEVRTLSDSLEKIKPSISLSDFGALEDKS